MERIGPRGSSNQLTVAVVRFPVRKAAESPTVQGVDAAPRQTLSLTTGLGALLLGLPR